MQYGKFATIYDLLMRDVPYDAWADYVIKMLDGCQTVLECACGTGEITYRLAKAGFDVIAADISDDMLRIATEKLRSMGGLSKRVHFIQMDMQRIVLHKPVDCVICCCDGVNYLTSDRAVQRFFNAAYSSLKPNGILLFDISSRYRLSTDLGCTTFFETGQDASYIWQNTYDDAAKLIKMELTFFKKQAALYERFDETHVQRAHSLKEIMSWLDKCGFDATAYDCFTQNPPMPNSERIQFFSRKRL